MQKGSVMRCTVQWTILGVVSWQIGCGMAAPGSAPTGTVSAALINAVPDSGDPYVGITSACTATLIGRRTALTAAHCGSDGTFGADFRVYPCGDPSCEQVFYGFFREYPGYGGNGDWDRDVGIIMLNEDVTSATGIVPRRIGSSPYEGERIYLVGYGRTDPDIDNFGQKHSGYNVITDLGDESIDYDDTSQTLGAEGDSGGPAIVPYTDCEVGVFDGTDPGFLGLDRDWELSRLDTKLGWIQQTSHDPSVYSCFQTVCGDGICHAGESCASCPQDCGACPAPVCGDGRCDGGESCTSCPGDCGACPGHCPNGTVHCCGEEDCIPAAVCHKRTC